jgi:sarcosine oxidase, subunit alpha
MSRFLPAGFYYKTFIHPRAVLEACVRAGDPPVGGSGPHRRTAMDRYEQLYALCDVLVAGGGVAGLQAALAAARAGARVIVMEQTAHWGGRAPVDGGTIDGKPPAFWVKTRCKSLKACRMSRCAPAAWRRGL